MKVFREFEGLRICQGRNSNANVSVSHVFNNDSRWNFEILSQKVILSVTTCQGSDRCFMGRYELRFNIRCTQFILNSFSADAEYYRTQSKLPRLLGTDSEYSGMKVHLLLDTMNCTTDKWLNRYTTVYVLSFGHSNQNSILLRRAALGTVAGCRTYALYWKWLRVY